MAKLTLSPNNSLLLGISHPWLVLESWRREKAVSVPPFPHGDCGLIWGAALALLCKYPPGEPKHKQTPLSCTTHPPCLLFTPSPRWCEPGPPHLWHRSLQGTIRGLQLDKGHRDTTSAGGGHRGAPCPGVWISWGRRESLDLGSVCSVWTPGGIWESYIHGSFPSPLLCPSLQREEQCRGYGEVVG